jgi:hypothetical protein
VGVPSGPQKRGLARVCRYCAIYYDAFMKLGAALSLAILILAGCAGPDLITQSQPVSVRLQDGARLRTADFSIDAPEKEWHWTTNSEGAGTDLFTRYYIARAPSDTHIYTIAVSTPVLSDANGALDAYLAWMREQKILYKNFVTNPSDIPFVGAREATLTLEPKGELLHLYTAVADASYMIICHNGANEPDRCEPFARSFKFNEPAAPKPAPRVQSL